MGLVTYRLDGAVATITMDDGRVNALASPMLEELNAGLDRAEADAMVVVLAGRTGVFSAGFDLSVLMGGGPDALAMLRGGFELAHRLLSFPKPVLIACTGHAIAMGSFLLLVGRPPDRHRRRLQDQLERSSDRADDAVGHDRDLPGATHAFALRASGRHCRAVRPPGRRCGRLPRSIAEPESFQEIVDSTAAALAMLNMEAPRRPSCALGGRRSMRSERRSRKTMPIYGR